MGVTVLVFELAKIKGGLYRLYYCYGNRLHYKDDPKWVNRGEELGKEEMK